MPDTGAPWNIPYVEGTDLVSDWPTDSLALANAIDAALDQVLQEIPVKKIEEFTSSGTWTVPAGVTYAIAHMIGGGGGIGSASGAGGNGGSSSVAFAGGTVTAVGGTGGSATGGGISTANSTAGQANSGRGAKAAENLNCNNGQDAQWFTAGDAVTPAASITVTVGAGGSTPGISGRDGGSGFVFIEYYE